MFPQGALKYVALRSQHCAPTVRVGLRVGRRLQMALLAAAWLLSLLLQFVLLQLLSLLFLMLRQELESLLHVLQLAFELLQLFKLHLQLLSVLLPKSMLDKLCVLVALLQRVLEKALVNGHERVSGSKGSLVAETQARRSVGFEAARRETLSCGELRV